MIYDIIGDVHGNFTLLTGLLRQLGYKSFNNSFFHPDRKPVFVGDLINRGNESRKTLHLVRNMVESGDGYAILGNHEIYAILINLKDQNGGLLVRINSELSMSMKNVLKEFLSVPAEWKSFRNWLRTLPLFLDFGDFRVVHAYWNDDYIRYFRENFSGLRIKKQVFREIYKNPASDLGTMIWQTTKGINFEVPADLRVRDNKGIFHRSFRMAWWDSPVGKTFEQISFEDKFRLPAYTVPPEIIPETTSYPEDAPILFFGHYRRFSGPYVIRPNVCCLDSGSGISKKLTAYSFFGEKVLDPKNLVHFE